MFITDLPTNGSYTHGGYVFPEYRGKKIFQSLKHSVYTDLKSKGCYFTGALVDKTNVVSILVQKRFEARFQNARLLKLPGIEAITIGKQFLMGISVSDPERNT